MPATRRIRAGDGPNASAPIIAISANVLDAQRRACNDAGMTGHIAKPIDARILLSTVISALSAPPDVDAAEVVAA